ncbi:hypothetical protein BBD41_24170 [Paenibacillus ihbetae]|uniref:Uncharacterized protein n=1 Tax=Paenibacillus ihbetae TaxID=1870820 RepID=A0A1B2E693_9BACL|nr:hypothetical protein [Paenibacillus ihbetae]ANY75417.1 hypothetical protein BBD41_24170 [Paenibacillus ihbetae]
MRTENQIKSKLNELAMQKKLLHARIAQLDESSPQRSALVQQEARLDDMMIMLEWVLNEPGGSYHM